jgi:hypothetical protein
VYKGIENKKNKRHTRFALSWRGTVGFDKNAAKFGVWSRVTENANNSPSTLSRIPAYGRSYTLRIEKLSFRILFFFESNLTLLAAVKTAPA